MRILILSNMYPSAEKPYAGIFVRNQVEVLRELLEPGWEIEFRAMQRSYTGTIGTLAKYAGFSLRCFPQLLRSYDLVHLHFFVPLGAMTAIYRILHPRSRQVVTFHGGDVAQDHLNGPLGSLWRAASRKVDLGIAVGPWVSESVQRYLRVRELVQEPVGVDSRKFYPRQSGEDGKRFDLVFAGSFIPRKGLDLLIESLRDPVFSNLRVAVVGTGALRKDLEVLARERQVEIFDHLTQDEMREVFCAARFLVLPSRSEPFGLVVTEALYCGTPAIVSDEPGLKMQVTDGYNGLVVARDSVQALKDGLNRAMALGAEEYRNMAAAAVQSNRHFDVYTVSARLIEYYKKLVAS